MGDGFCTVEGVGGEGKWGQLAEQRYRGRVFRYVVPNEGHWNSLILQTNALELRFRHLKQTEKQNRSEINIIGAIKL